MAGKYVVWCSIAVVTWACLMLGGCRKSLHKAIISSDIRTITRLIKDGADIDAPDKHGDTPLHLAALIGRADVVKLLIDKGASIDAKNSSGWTPLDRCAENGFMTIAAAKVLIDNGADVHAVTNEGESVLHIAVTGGSADFVKLMLEAGVDVECRDNYGRTPLHILAENGGRDAKAIAQVLLAAGANPLTTTEDRERTTPLDDAALSNNLDVARVLLASLDVDAPDEDGDMLLHRAIKSGNVKLVQVLIESGADINAKDAQGDTPLFVATLAREEQIAGILKAAGAVAEGGAEVSAGPGEPTEADLLGQAREMIAQGRDINVADVAGCTLLHKAAECGYVKLAELLLSEHAELNVHDKAGLTPLHYAVMQAHIDIAKLLVANKADVDCTDEQGHTPLHFAVMGNTAQVELARFLLDAGASVNAATHGDMCTPLDLATRYADVDLIELLIKRGADVNCVNCDGATPLHIAASHGYDEIARLLLAHGANKHARNSRGRTPSEAAHEAGHPEMSQILDGP